MKRIKSSLFIMVMLILAISMGACSKPPESEKEAAKKAMDAAFSAGAENMHRLRQRSLRKPGRQLKPR